MVAAAGNDSRRIEVYNSPSLTDPYVDTELRYMFPASYPEVIAVSATGKTGKKDYFASFSNYGPAVNLAAPGNSIETTTIGGGYATSGGTSSACPHVVGAAALVLRQFGPQSPDWVRTRLMDTTEWIKQLTAEQQGVGLVDAEAAVGGQAAPGQHTTSSKDKLATTWGELKNR